MKPGMLLIGGATPRMMDQFNEAFEVHIASQIDNLTEYLAENGENIGAIATSGKDGAPVEVMSALPNLKVISSYGVGYDGIDTQAAVDRGIIVTHTPTVLNKDVANTALMLILATSRRLIRDSDYLRSGEWEKHGEAPLTNSIEGSKVGIVGLGRIGETLAHKLSVFDCEISYHNRNEKPDSPYTYYGDLVEMAREVDSMVVITPGGPATRKLITREVMDALGPEGMLINIGRGPVVDEPELIKALQAGTLGCAGLDVFEKEPSVPAELLEMDNVTLTPHVGSSTRQTRQAMGDLTVENLVRYFTDGKVITPVPECVHYADKVEQ
ncbi:MAG: 2-hydroxyacid dehydrogenase [Pseudomonadota bacterium]